MRTAKSVFIVAALITSLLFSVIAADTAQAQGSTVHNVIETGGRSAALVLDRNDYPVVAYTITDETGTSLKVARCADVRCEQATVQKVAEIERRVPGDRNRLVTSVSMVLDAGDRPVLGYSVAIGDEYGGTGEITIARCRDRVCAQIDRETVASGLSPWLTLDRNDNPVLAYIRVLGDGDQSSTVIEAVRCEDAVCRSAMTHQIDDGVERRAPVVEIDNDDNMVVAYVRPAVEADPEISTPSRAVVARCVNYDCSSKNRAIVGPAWSLAMKLDVNGLPILIMGYNDNTDDFGDGLILYVRCNDAACQDLSTKVFKNTRYEYLTGVNRSALAVGPNDVVAFWLSYEEDSDAFPEIVYCRTRACDAPESGGELGGERAYADRYDISPIALDGNGHPVVAYSSGSLVLAQCGSSVCDNDSLPTIDGRYYLQNVGSNRYLDADADGSVGTSLRPTADDVWEFTTDWWESWTLRNVYFDGYLNEGTQGDRRPAVGELGAAGLWTVRPGLAHVVINGSKLATEAGGPDVRLVDFQEEDRTLWRLIPVEPVAPSPYVGRRLALQNAATSRWLDADQNGAVNQSVNQGADDVWQVVDAGDGHVYLMNEVTQQYLDADQGRSVVDSSLSLARDKRWHIMMQADGQVLVRNVRFGGHLTAGGRDQSFNATREDLSLAAYWSPIVLD